MRGEERPGQAQAREFGPPWRWRAERLAILWLNWRRKRRTIGLSPATRGAAQLQIGGHTMVNSPAQPWTRIVFRAGALGGVIGGLVGLALLLPGFITSLSFPIDRTNSLISVVQLVALASGVGAGLAAAVGMAYARGRRSWFWFVLAVLALFVGLFNPLSRGEPRVWLVLTIAAGVLVTSFGLWALVEAALHTWRTRPRR